MIICGFLKAANGDPFQIPTALLKKRKMLTVQKEIIASMLRSSLSSE